MKSHSPPLCQFCEAKPALVGDLYCCDGCRILSSTKDQVQLLTQDEDVDLIKNYATEQKGQIAFQCRVDPLACEACLQSLAVMSEQFTGLQDLKWDRETSVLSFSFSKSHLFPSALYSHLKALRLNPHWVSRDEATQAQPSARRSKLMALGLTGAFAGNIMLFAVPIYGGLDGAIRTAFEWIQLAFFLPVFFWSAKPFYRTALVSITTKTLSVDLPLTIAFIAGSIFSFYSLLSGGHDLYFDSLAGFFFLILTSRYLLENSLEKFLQRPQLNDFFEKPFYRIERAGQKLNLPWQQIDANDLLYIVHGDRVPTDGKLQNRGAEFEMAWMTGELHPVLRLKDSEIQAGSRLISKEATIVVTKPALETHFAELLKQIKPAPEKLQISTEGRIGTWLVAICFLSLIGLFIFAPELGFQEILRRGVAVFIVACPCAISFAAPLARARANRLALKFGFWIRNTDVWNHLLTIKKVAFDKTGTLTSGRLRLTQHSPLLDSHWKRIILSLENISRHPIAESLRQAWGELELDLVTNPQEILGLGVQGEIKGHLYRLQKSRNQDETIGLELYQDDQKVLELSLEEEPIEQLGTTLQYFKSKFQVFLISGDQTKKVQKFASLYGFSKENAWGDLNPEMKLKKIEELSPDLYFGDGTNDLLALKTTPISVAVAGASLEAQASADMLLLDSDLSTFPKIFELAKETKKVNHRNFALALTYNIASGAAALLGLVHPLVAALLMPVASLTLLASTLYATKKIRQMEKTK